MTKFIKKSKYSCLFFTEGKKDRDFLYALVDFPKFRYYSSDWRISFDNASGCSPRDILSQCSRVTKFIDYDLIICFIDLDKLKGDYKKTWEKEKILLETEFSKFKIIWQKDKAEDEYKRVLGQQAGKYRINQIAKQNIDKFVNSDYWNCIKNCIKDREKELEY